MPLISLADAKHHLKVTTATGDVDIQAKVDQAIDIVVGYLKSQADAGWNDGSVEVPGRVRAAVFIALEGLHEHRAIDWTTIERLLVGLRDPALA